MSKLDDAMDDWLDSPNFDDYHTNSFKAGAKWMAEQVKRELHVYDTISGGAITEISSRALELLDEVLGD